jgi:predicted patatin/cPLA2 family phospholipase
MNARQRKGTNEFAVRHIIRAIPALYLGLLMSTGCGTIQERKPIPEHLAAEAEIPGIPNARAWGDDAPPYAEMWMNQSKEELSKKYGGVMGKEHHYMAISGGGSNGAFAAGLLCGWTASGNRPEFTLVTGISTGALIAPFAFLGPDYDDTLKRFYTTVTDDDVFEKRSTLSGIQSDAFADSAPLRKLIAENLDDEVVARIAEECRKGRELFIGTTNLDAGRPVHWDIGMIATSGDPKAAQLIRDVMLASASIPVAFPPVLMSVEAGGERYDEIHVDGGVSTQVFLYPLDIDWAAVKEKLDVRGTPSVYIIRNSKLKPKWKTIDPAGLRNIAGQTISSLIRTQGIGDLYRMYVSATRDGLDYNLAHIPDDFNEDKDGEFDPVYMKKLFDTAYEAAKSGYSWLKKPPT